MNALPCADVRPLLPLLSSDELEPAEAPRLDEHLASCAACRREAERFFRQDRALAELAAANLVDPLAERIRAQLDAEQATPAVSSTMKVMRTCLFIAAAAAVLIALSLWGFPRSRSHGDLARIVNMTGRITLSGNGDTAVGVGNVLPPDALLQTVGDDSFAVVRYDDGTQITLAADTKLAIDVDPASGAKRLVLHEGFLTADVAEQPAGRPMQLSTPQAELIVLGTKFQLSGGSEVTFVETTEGSVRVKRKRDGQSVDVDGGFEASVGAAAGPLTAQLIPTAAFSPQFTLENGGPCRLSPNGTKLLAAPYFAGETQWIEAATGKPLHHWSAHRKRTVAAAIAPDGRTVATAGLDGIAKVWDAATNELRREILLDDAWVADAAFSADDQSLAVLAGREGEEERRLTIWDLATGERRRPPLEFTAQRWAFSPDGSQFAAYDRRAKRIRVWSLPDGELQAAFGTPVGNNVFCLAFSPDGQTLACDGSSGLVTFCDAATGEVLRRIERRGGRIFGMTYSPDGRTLATGHQDGTIRLWNLAASTQVALFPGMPGAHARAIEFTPDGRTLLAHETRLATDAAGRNGAVMLWDVPPVSLLEKKNE